MPGVKQKTVSMPLDVWMGFVEAYEADPKKWMVERGVKSPTGLIVWVLRGWLYALENP